MKPDTAIVALFADDIQATLKLQPWLAEDGHWICLSIDAYEQCLLSSLPSVELPDWLQQRSTFSVKRHARYGAALRELDESAARSRQAIGFTDRAHWNHRHHLFLLTGLAAWQDISTDAQTRLRGHGRYIVPHRASPADYHFPGALPASILTCALRASGLEVESLHLPYHQLKPAYAPHVYEKIPNFWGAEITDAWRRSDQITLMSSAGLFYPEDKEKLAHLLAALGIHQNNWALACPFWNSVPDAKHWGTRIPIQAAYACLDSELRGVVADLVSQMAGATAAAFEEVLGSEITKLAEFSQQIGRMRQRYFFQVMTFLGLTHLQMSRPADAIVVTALDGGLNGPLHSLSEEFRIPNYILPHSHVVNVHTEGQGTVLTEYWQPRPSTDFRGRPNPTIHLPGAPIGTLPGFAEHAQPKVTLLFNGIHRGPHISTPIKLLKDTVRALRQMCSTHSADLIFRLKPGDQTPLRAYSQLLEIDEDSCRATLTEPLDQVLQHSDLIVAIDDPSSAVWRAIELGCGVVLMADRPFVYSTLIDETIITSHSPQQGLALIEQMLTDPDLLIAYRKRQVQALADLRQARLIQHESEPANTQQPAMIQA